MNQPISTPLKTGLPVDPKIQVKAFVGAVLARLNSTRAIARFRRPQHDAGMVDRLIMTYLKKRSIAEQRSGYLERLHASFWQGKPGAEFSENCDHRFQDLFLANQLPDFRELKSLLAPHPEFDRVVEIGTCSGLFLNYIVNCIPQINQAIGIDINQEQILANVRKNKEARIQYAAANAATWIVDHPRQNTLYVSNGGVLEYFSRETLNGLMQTIAKTPPAIFYSSEPVAIDHDPDNTASIPFGNELSFSHNYKDLFESNGFHCVYQRPTDFVAACGTQYRMLVSIAASPQLIE